MIPLVAAPTLGITLSHDDPIYESTLFSLTCTVLLPNSIDTPVSLNYIWRNPHGNIIVSDGRLSFNTGTNNQTLVFNPIDNGDSNSMQTDSGQYKCELYVSSSDVNIISTNHSTYSKSLSVEGKNATVNSMWTVRLNRMILLFCH